jgi:hypothetical protein
MARPPSAGSPNLKKDLKISNFKMVEQAAPGRVEMGDQGDQDRGTRADGNHPKGNARN